MILHSSDVVGSFVMKLIVGGTEAFVVFMGFGSFVLKKETDDDDCDVDGDVNYHTVHPGQE